MRHAVTAWFAFFALAACDAPTRGPPAFCLARDEPAFDPPTPAAHEVFVSLDGDDDGDGSAAAPWRTLAFAAAQLSAGDTLVVRPGVWDEGMELRASGDDGGPISIRGDAATGTRPTVGPIAIYGSHVIVEDLAVTSAGTDEPAVYVNGPQWEPPGAERVVLRRLDVFGSTQQGIMMSGDNNAVLDSEVHDNVACENGAANLDVDGAGDGLILDGNRDSRRATTRPRPSATRFRRPGSPAATSRRARPPEGGGWRGWRRRRRRWWCSTRRRARAPRAAARSCPSRWPRRPWC
jgi:hypothetical protein